MKDFNTIDEILDFAINSEQEAVGFYTRLAREARNKDMQKVFSDFAKEEMGHKARITKIKEEGLFNTSEETVIDLKISNYILPTEIKADMTYQEALILAMNREKKAFQLYEKLASKSPTPELQKIFKNLALEESRHKLRFELEYDEFVLREN